MDERKFESAYGKEEMVMTDGLKDVACDDGPYPANGSVALLYEEDHELRAGRAIVARRHGVAPARKPFCGGGRSGGGSRAVARASRWDRGKA